VIEEVAGAVKDLLKAGRVRQFGMSRGGRRDHSASARCSTRTKRSVTIGSRRSAAGHLTSRPMVMSTPQPPTQAARRRLAAGCAWLVRALTECLVRAPAVVVGVTQCGVCCLSFVKRLVA
jgi:hypothetical protein